MLMIRRILPCATKICLCTCCCGQPSLRAISSIFRVFPSERTLRNSSRASKHSTFVFHVGEQRGRVEFFQECKEALASFRQFVHRPALSIITPRNECLAKQKVDVAIYYVEVQVGPVNHLCLRNLISSKIQKIVYHLCCVPSSGPVLHTFYF